MLILVLSAPAAAGPTRSRAETLAMQRAYTEAERRCKRIAAWSKCCLGSAPARRLCLLRVRLAALGGSVLPATASGARAIRFRSRRFHRLGPFRHRPHTPALRRWQQQSWRRHSSAARPCERGGSALRESTAEARRTASLTTSAVAVTTAACTLAAATLAATARPTYRRTGGLASGHGWHQASRHSASPHPRCADGVAPWARPCGLRVIGVAAGRVGN